MDRPIFSPGATPQIVKKPVQIEQHGRRRCDDFAWLRDENWQGVLRDPSLLTPEIRRALEAENAYYETATEDIDGLRETIRSEMRGRIKENDASVPRRDGPFHYFTKFREGGEYPIYARRRGDRGEEQVLFDGDAESTGKAFFDIGAFVHSPDHKLLAISIDVVGSEYFEITVKDIETDTLIEAALTSADGGGVVWSADSSGFFYIERDDHQRPKLVRYHKLGDRQSDDRVVYEETDDGFFLSLSQSQDRRYIFVEAGNHSTSEVWMLNAKRPEDEARLIAGREHGVEYSVDHRNSELYILTNADGAFDFKIVTAPVNAPDRAHWREFLPHRPGVYILSCTVYNDFMVRLEREAALPRIVITTFDGYEHAVAFDDAAYSIGVDSGFLFDTDLIRFTYETPARPRETYDYNVRTRERILLKTQEVPSGHDSSKYIVERIFSTAPDGEQVPVTIVRLASIDLNGNLPVLLYGYGAYGITIPASFSTNILSLVDRGVVYAIAHVRGGAAKGRRWYLNGKREYKTNSFFDFVAVAEGMIESGYTRPGRIVIHGGSAGGLLVGASVNMRPDLFAGVIAAVPFVDVLNTISDAKLPLTPPEWDEWGNPVDSAEQYDWIAGYSPYDNVTDAEYPAILATGGLTDYRVTYWEPAKWIARLRDRARGGPFFLRMNLDAGHGGSAARFEQLDERAHLYAFALRALDCDHAPLVTHQ